jgi:hypothetical protein
LIQEYTMNRQSIRALLLGAMLVALLATMASSAGASTWRSHGRSFTANAGTNTFDFSGGPFTCPTATATGTVAGPTGPVLPSVWVGAVTGTMRIDGCTMPVPGFSMHCNYALAATSTTATNDISGATTGTAVLHCILYTGATPCRTITGSVGTSYANPSVTTGTARLILNSSTTLTSDTIGSQGCFWPTGPVRFTGASFHIASGAPSFWAS